MKNSTLTRIVQFSAAAALAIQGVSAVPVSAQGVPTPVSTKASGSSQENLARDYALSSGRKNFLVLDKKNAQLVGIENGQEIFRHPVFLGKVFSDDLQPTLGATPAGAFNAVVNNISSGRKSGAFERFGSYIPYLCVPGRPGPKKTVSPDICYSIHPTLQTAAESRALATGSPDARRISNACVRDTNYKQTADFITRHANEGAMLLIILPYDQSKTRSYLNIPASFQPNR